MSDSTDSLRAAQIAAVLAAAAAAQAAIVPVPDSASPPPVATPAIPAASNTRNVQAELIHTSTPISASAIIPPFVDGFLSSSDSESLDSHTSSASSYTPSPALLRKQGKANADASTSRLRRTSRTHNPLLRFDWDDFADDDELDPTTIGAAASSSRQTTHQVLSSNEQTKRDKDEDDDEEEDDDDEDDEDYQNSEPTRSHDPTRIPRSYNQHEVRGLRGKYRPRTNPGPELTALLEQVSSGVRAASQAELVRIQLLQRRLERWQRREASEKSKEERKLAREEIRKTKLETGGTNTTVSRKRKSVDESTPSAGVVSTSPVVRRAVRRRTVQRALTPPPPEVQLEVEVEIEPLVESTDDEAEKEFANELLNSDEIPVDLSEEEGSSSNRPGGAHYAVETEFELLRAHTKLVERSLWHLKVLQIPDTRMTQYAAKVVENAAELAPSLPSSTNSSAKHKQAGHPAPAFIKKCFYPPRLNQLPTFTVLSALLDTAEKMFDNEAVGSISEENDSKLTPSAWAILSHDS